MRNYLLEVAGGRDGAATKRLVDVSTSQDFARRKASAGCTLVSSSSQVKVVEKSTALVRAEFAAFRLSRCGARHCTLGRVP